MLSCRQAAIAICTVLLTSSLLSQTFHGTVPVTSYPQAIAVNPFTDKIYTIDEPANDITEIDGVTNATTTIPLGLNAEKSLNGALAINPLTNTIYAVDGVNNHLAIIDGATRAVTFVPTGTNAYALAVNPYTNKIYVANFGDGTVTVVDAMTLATTTVNVGVHPSSVAIDRSPLMRDVRPHSQSLWPASLRPLRSQCHPRNWRHISC